MTSIPDQFYKSRVVAVTTSLLAFAASVTAESQLQSMKILEITLTGLNKPFLIVSFLIASLISLASLYLIYRNEGLRYISERSGFPEGQSPVETARKLSETVGYSDYVLKNVDEQYERLRAIVYATGSAPIEISEEEYQHKTRYIFKGQQFEYLKLKIGELHDLIVHNKGDSEQALVESRFIQLRNEIETQLLENLIDGVKRLSSSPEHPVFLPDIMIDLKGMTTSLNLLKGALDTQIDMRKRAKRELKAEISWLGLGVPISVFVIAVLHALGAFGFHLAPALPTLIEKVLPPV